MKDKRKIILSGLIIMTIVFASILGVCVFGGEGKPEQEQANEETVVQNTEGQVEETAEGTKQEIKPLASNQPEEQAESSQSPVETTDPTATVDASIVPGTTQNSQSTTQPGETNMPVGETVAGIQSTPGHESTQAPTSVNPTTEQQVTEGPTAKPSHNATNTPATTSAAPTVTPTKKPTDKPSEKPQATVTPTEPESKITFTVDASVIGNGCYVSNHQVTLKAGEPAAATITRGLQNAGFSYDNTGTINSNFYLSRIKKSGMVKSPSISSHIQDILDDNGVRLRINKYESDSLGEFDFTNYSGWRYSVNGTYAGVGMSDYELKDGDRVLLKYTLCLGYDA